MKMPIFFSVLTLSAVLAMAPKWKPETEKAKVNFDIKGPFGTVHGKFSGLKADIKFSPDDLSGSSVKASIDANTVSTGINLRNRDLRKKEVWLDTDKYPRITYVSNKIEKKGSGYVAVGDLTLKGKTKPVSIPFTFSGKNNTGTFKGKFTINREDYNVGKAGGSVGKTITIELVVPAIK